MSNKAAAVLAASAHYSLTTSTREIGLGDGLKPIAEVNEIRFDGRVIGFIVEDGLDGRLIGVCEVIDDTPWDIVDRMDASDPEVMDALCRKVIARWLYLTKRA